MTSPEMTRDDYYKTIIRNYKSDKLSIKRTIEFLEEEIKRIDKQIEDAETEWEQEINN
jgi:hypothetical protein